MRKHLVLLLTAAAVLASCAEDGAGNQGDREGETPAECSDVSSSGGAPAPVTMKETFFEPFCLAASSTQPLALTNAGQAVHNFSIEDQGVDIDVSPGEETTTEPLGDLVSPGTFRFICKYHQAQGMVGTLTVE